MYTFSGDETAPFLGFLDVAVVLVFSCMGATYGTAKSGVGVASMGVMRSKLVMKSIIPVVMARVLGIYGLIIAIIISTDGNEGSKSFTGTSRINSSGAIHNLQHKEDEGHRDYLIQGGKVSKGFEFWF
ncbi:hypothetical protein AAG906_016852 [Vitis piasezkii]